MFPGRVLCYFDNGGGPFRRTVSFGPETPSGVVPATLRRRFRQRATDYYYTRPLRRGPRKHVGRVGLGYVWPVTITGHARE